MHGDPDCRQRPGPRPERIETLFNPGAKTATSRVAASACRWSANWLPRSVAPSCAAASRAPEPCSRSSCHWRQPTDLMHHCRAQLKSHVRESQWSSPGKARPSRQRQTGERRQSLLPESLSSTMNRPCDGRLAPPAGQRPADRGLWFRRRDTRSSQHPLLRPADPRLPPA